MSNLSSELKPIIGNKRKSDESSDEPKKSVKINPLIRSSSIGPDNKYNEYNTREKLTPGVDPKQYDINFDYYKKEYSSAEKEKNRKIMNELYQKYYYENKKKEGTPEYISNPETLMENFKRNHPELFGKSIWGYTSQNTVLLDPGDPNVGYQTTEERTLAKKEDAEERGRQMRRELFTTAAKRLGLDNNPQITYDNYYDLSKEIQKKLDDERFTILSERGEEEKQNKIKKREMIDRANEEIQQLKKSRQIGGKKSRKKRKTRKTKMNKRKTRRNRKI